MNRLTLRASALALSFAMAPGLYAGEVDHYAAEQVETLDAAVATFAEYNTRLGNVLARDPLATADIEEIHEYTYTLEAALAKITAEATALAVTLETLHQVSEGHDLARLRPAAAAYLEVASTLAR